MGWAFFRDPGTTSRDTSSREIPKLRRRSGARCPNYFCRWRVPSGSQLGHYQIPVPTVNRFYWL